MNRLRVLSIVKNILTGPAGKGFHLKKNNAYEIHYAALP